MFFTFIIVVILTAIVLVVAAMTIAKLLAPRSFNPQKGEPYECGIPTRGQSWVQFKAGYYLFAILFLMFDIETVFLFPWAVVAGQVGSICNRQCRFLPGSFNFGPGIRLAERSS